MLEIYNTLTRKKEIFKPLKSNEVKVYYCGPTVYNYAHIWNLRSFIFEDIVVKSLKFLWYNVKTLMNITDVDDKTIKASIESWDNLKDFTKKYTEIFLQDIEKLWINKADDVVPVTTVIPEMVRMINTMLKRWFAYLSSDNSIYFKISKFKKYWLLANLDLSSLKESVRIDNDEYDKESASDFALWKAYSKEDWKNFWEEKFEIDWKKQVIKWRPGWHIECSACNMKYFWQQIDIHMWGVDLIFPHHQNEIAQTESCTRKTFSKYWIHSWHLMVEWKKMSKSLWNFYTLRDVEKRFPDINKSILYRAIRLSFINWKYRDSIEFNFDKLKQAINTISKIDESVKKLLLAKNNDDFKNKWVSKEFRDYMQDIISKYIEDLENNFNIPEVMAVFFDFQKFIKSNLKKNNLSKEEINSIIDMLKTFNEVLWIIDNSLFKNKLDKIPKSILKKLEDRNNAKKQKDFKLADKLRDELEQSWYRVIDDRQGSRVEKI